MYLYHVPLLSACNVCHRALFLFEIGVFGEKFVLTRFQFLGVPQARCLDTPAAAHTCPRPTPAHDTDTRHGLCTLASLVALPPRPGLSEDATPLIPRACAAPDTPLFVPSKRDPPPRLPSPLPPPPSPVLHYVLSLAHTLYALIISPRH